jgi:hypothetical protein
MRGKHGENPWPKNTQIAKGKGISDKEWDDAALKVGMAMLSMQLVPEALRALGP